MPRVVFWYKRGTLSDIEIGDLANPIRDLVAKAVDFGFTRDDVDFIPMELHPSTASVQMIMIDIETIGFDERKARLNEKAVLELKREIVMLRQFPDHFRPHFMKGENQLVWTRFQDPAGVHV